MNKINSTLMLNYMDKAAKAIVNGDKSKAAITTRKYLQLGKDIPCATKMNANETFWKAVASENDPPENIIGRLFYAISSAVKTVSTKNYAMKKNNDLVKVMQETFEKQYPKTGELRNKLLNGKKVR